MMKSEIPLEDKDQARGLRRPSIEESALILFQMMKQSPPSPPSCENAKPSRWDDQNTKPSSSSSSSAVEKQGDNQKFQTSPITSTPTVSNSNHTNNNKNNSPHPLPLTSSPTSPSSSHFEEEASEQHHGFNSNNHYNYNIGSNNNNNNEQTASPSPSSCHLPSCLLCSRGQPLLLIKSPTWASIMRVVFFCLKHDFPSKHFFSLKTDVYSFMLCHWEKLCLNKKRSDNWHKQIQDMLSHSKNLFESGMDKYKQNGYWRLKQMIDPWTIQKDRSSKKLPGPGQHLHSPKRGLELMENGSPNPTPPSSSSSNSPRDEEQEEEQIEFETLRIPTSHNSPLTKKLRLNSPPASPELTIDDETEYIAKSNANEHHNTPRTRTPTPTRNLSSPPNLIMGNYYPLSKSATALPTTNTTTNNNNNNSHTPLSSPSPQTIHHQPPLQPQQQQQYAYASSQQPQPQPQPQPQSQPQQSQTGFVGEVQSLRSQLSSMTESLLAIKAQLRKKPSFLSPTPPLAHSGMPYPQSHNHSHVHNHNHTHTHTPPHPTHAAVYPSMPLAPSHYASMSPYGYRLYTDENMWCYDERLRKGTSSFPSTSFELPPIASLPHARPSPAYSSPHYVFSPPSSACTTPNISSSPDIHMNKIHPFYSHSIISPHMPIHAHHPTRLYSTPPPRTISMVANH